MAPQLAFGLQYVQRGPKVWLLTASSPNAKARQLAANQQRLAEDERARAERLVAQQRLNLYASRMKLAHEAWQSGDVAACWNC